MSDDLTEACEAQALNFQNDPFRYQKFNLAQTRFLRALKEPKVESLTIVLFLKPNRIGGSRILMGAWSAIMFGTERPAAQCSPFGDWWPFPVRNARLVSTAETLGDVGPLQKAMRDLFPVGRYTQSRGVGKAYNSAGKTDNGWTWDAMSYGQGSLAAAGSTMGLILMSEPPPKDLYVECLTRLGGNGMMIIECTQLDLAPWLEEFAEDAGGVTRDGIQYGTLKLDGRAVGEVRVVRGDIEDSCSEHSNGHQSHSAIEATIAGWPVEEREARRRGVPLKLSGRIYPEWGDANELEEVPEWHRKQWDAGEVILSSVLDPADQKPWAMAWFATYPNNDVICFMEWPTFNFDECKISPIHALEDYRNTIIECEAAVGRPQDKRYIDPLFGNAPGKGNARTLRKMLSSPCKECLRHVGRAEYEDLDERSEAYLSAEISCKHKLSYLNSIAYNGSVRDGHIIVRAQLGEKPNGIRPKFYALKSCANMCRGMRRYAWRQKTNAETDDKPSLIYKDFPDLWRLGALKRFHEYPKDHVSVPLSRPGRLWTPRVDPLPMKMHEKRPKKK